MTAAGDGLDLYEDLLVENSGEGEGHFRAEVEEVSSRDDTTRSAVVPAIFTL